MKHWVQRCPRCGFCATNLSRGHEYDLPVAPLAGYERVWVAPTLAHGTPSPSATEHRGSLQVLVESEGYRAQLHNRYFPKLANSFLCQSLADEAEGRYVDATIAALHAAWVCDEAVRFRRARECRARVVEMTQKASAANQSFGVRLTSRTAILVDALRRIGSFDTAAATCKEALVTEPDEFLRNVLQFQLELIRRRYAAAYSLDDAMRWSPKAWGVEQWMKPRAPHQRWWFWSVLGHGLDSILGNA